jgi:hypothetical protein
VPGGFHQLEHPLVSKRQERTVTKDQSPGDRISAVVTGPVQGQVAIGKTIAQHQEAGSMAIGLSDAEQDELEAVFAKLREDVAAAVPEADRPGAIERLSELHEAVAAEKPDLTTVQYVKGWFIRKAPAAAGLVASVLIHPLVGQIIERAGNNLADSIT